jgi:hypothetical protein
MTLNLDSMSHMLDFAAREIAATKTLAKRRFKTPIGDLTKEPERAKLVRSLKRYDATPVATRSLQYGHALAGFHVRYVHRGLPAGCVRGRAGRRRCVYEQVGASHFLRGRRGRVSKDADFHQRRSHGQQV